MPVGNNSNRHFLYNSHFSHTIKQKKLNQKLFKL